MTVYLRSQFLHTMFTDGEYQCVSLIVGNKKNDRTSAKWNNVAEDAIEKYKSPRQCYYSIQGKMLIYVCLQMRQITGLVECYNKFIKDKCNRWLLIPEINYFPIRTAAEFRRLFPKPTQTQVPNVYFY